MVKDQHVPFSLLRLSTIATEIFTANALLFFALPVLCNDTGVEHIAKQGRTRSLRGYHNKIWVGYDILIQCPQAGPIAARAASFTKFTRQGNDSLSEDSYPVHRNLVEVLT